MNNAPPSPATRALYSLLLRVRPAQLGALLKTLLRIRRCYVTTQLGQHFWLDPVSVFGQAVLTKGAYEPILTRIVQGLLSAGDVFVDVGANEGYFSVLAASCVGGAGAVHAIEPQRRLNPVLRHNAEINSAETIAIHNVVLADRVGTAQLFLRPSLNTGSSSIFRHWRFGSKHELVPALTLDEFFRRNSLERVRLIKVDCEGAEHLVVAGGSEVFGRQAIDILALEYHPAICGSQNCERTHERLRAFGLVASRLDGHLLYHRPGLEEPLSRIGNLTTGSGWHS
jgi:FkbM family methyltransferase